MVHGQIVRVEMTLSDAGKKLLEERKQELYNNISAAEKAERDGERQRESASRRLRAYWDELAQLHRDLGWPS